VHGGQLRRPVASTAARLQHRHVTLEDASARGLCPDGAGGAGPGEQTPPACPPLGVLSACVGQAMACRLASVDIYALNLIRLPCLSIFSAIPLMLASAAPLGPYAAPCGLV
jgi:hypothetical protein